MTLDSWLAIKGITRQDLGRMLGIKPVHAVHRWMQFLVCGRRNLRYHPPGTRFKLKIRKLTKNLVNLNDWPDAHHPQE